MDRREEIEKNLNRVTSLIDAATQHAGRTPGSVSLLPVTKFHPISDIRILADLGITAVGENREQEARSKHEELPNMKFHMIGQVQTKKANAVARWATAVHSIDSLRLAESLNRGVSRAIDAGERSDSRLDSLIQLSLDGDPERGGVIADDIVELAEFLEGSENLRFLGLMCVPPLQVADDRAFAQAEETLRAVEQHFSRALEFSAGMSKDLECAIRYGSTIVRVGTDILGARLLA